MADDDMVKHIINVLKKGKRKWRVCRFCQKLFFGNFDEYEAILTDQDLRKFGNNWQPTVICNADY